MKTVYVCHLIYYDQFEIVFVTPSKKVAEAWRKDYEKKNKRKRGDGNWAPCVDAVELRHRRPR